MSWFCFQLFNILSVIVCDRCRFCSWCLAYADPFKRWIVVFRRSDACSAWKNIVQCQHIWNDLLISPRWTEGPWTPTCKLLARRTANLSRYFQISSWVSCQQLVYFNLWNQRLSKGKVPSQLVCSEMTFQRHVIIKKIELDIFYQQYAGISVYSLVYKWATQCTDEREIWHRGADHCSCVPNFTFIGAEMWEYSLQNCRNRNFPHKFSPRGRLVFTVFTQI